MNCISRFTASKSAEATHDCVLDLQRVRRSKTDNLSYNTNVISSKSTVRIVSSTESLLKWPHCYPADSMECFRTNIRFGLLTLRVKTMPAVWILFSSIFTAVYESWQFLWGSFAGSYIEERPWISFWEPLQWFPIVNSRIFWTWFSNRWTSQGGKKTADVRGTETSKLRARYYGVRCFGCLRWESVEATWCYI